MTTQTRHDVVLVNAAQVAAARLLSELREERGEPVDSRLEAIANAGWLPADHDGETAELDHSARSTHLLGGRVSPDVVSEGKSPVTQAPSDQDLDGIALWKAVLASAPSTSDAGDSLRRHAQTKLIGQYWKAGRSQDAIAVQKQQLADIKRTSGSSNEHSLAARAALARLHRSAGNFTEAVALDEAILAEHHERFGAYHRATRAAQAALAESYRAARQLDHAIRLGEEVLSQSVALEDPKHADVLSASEALAASYMAAGDTARAISLATRCAKCGRPLHSHAATAND